MSGGAARGGGVGGVDKGASGGIDLGGGGLSLLGGESSGETKIRKLLMWPHELGQMLQGQSVVFDERGDVRRVYFPDASHPRFDGVCDMMATAARIIRGN